MSQRIHLNPNAPRAPMMGTGYTPDPVPRPAASQAQDGLLSQVQEISSKAEDYIETYTQPVRPWVPAMARFLIVVTFLEGERWLRTARKQVSGLIRIDALRIMTQWSDQIWYLQRSALQSFETSAELTPGRHRKFPWGLSHLFLFINVVVSLLAGPFSRC